ncbi:MAG: flavin reductase family protein [Candidatus Heteroscillospira sp.]|jgi:flavin reductase (DIM6/NTAB) family NADH-FMN oxidoreductase RutF
MSLVKYKPEEMGQNVFKTLSDWMLLTAGDRESFNTMTVSWGGLGIIWNKPVATVYVRPQRYTYEFMENSDYFTLSAYPEDMHKALAFCGAKSGRDVDKVKECSLHPAVEEGGVYFQGAKLVLVCRKLYYQDIAPQNFLDASIEKNYANNDYHRMYIGEIVSVLAEN